MRSYSFPCLSLVVALALACDSKPNDSDTANIDSSTGTDGTSSDGTDGVSSTGGTSGGDPATTTAGTATATVTSASGSTSAGTETATEPGTSGYDPTATATGTSSEVTSASDVTTDGPPLEPTPCEGEAIEIDAAALAYTDAQVPPDPDPTGESSGTSGGEPPDPNTLHVRLSNQVATCADPNAGLECGGNWEVSIRIPPAFQTPGLYHLLGPDVTGHAMETGNDEDPDACSFGGGSFSATFELISIDDKEVVGRLCHVDFPFFDTNPNLEGKFTAPRCQ
ncbi:hypothetical protein SAMN02745121_06447 [Nannocystis exedens]|uniref:Uncharacterized protein n=1 Tax=Nannocystis exedens TaxID=54 RepID=A0A1I2F5C9_9BACT|nr:hypothetical protein [Nannocystis exedens]PCC73091.1 hypothetical protein NAEX_06177 [Nannocystis exedens]SFF00375.1 hypothetical protein SAMN02745121_06447 [Nannocystis exedens]